MKARKIIIVITILSAFILCTPSCIVVREDNGRHRGWNKNSNNPHHPASTNPGHGNGNKNGKGKGK